MNNKTMILCAALAMSAASASAQLLKGSISGFNPGDEGITVVYSPTGGVINTDYKTLQVAADGTFTYDEPITDRNADIDIYVLNKTYGAHLVKGQTVSVSFTMGKDSTVSMTVEGPDEKVSRVVNAMSQAYDIMLYFPMDPALEKSNAEYRALLDNNYRRVLPLLKGIRDKQQRKFYTDLNEARYKWMKVRLIMDRCEKDSTRYQDDAEYRTLTGDVDLNSDIAFRSNLGFSKLMAMVKTPMNFKGDMGDYCREIMALADKYVTNPYLRSDIAKTVAQNYFVYGSNSGDYHKFYDDAVSWAGADSTAFTPYKAQMASWDKTLAGTKAFDITLTDRDGNTCQLSDIAKGKMTYIDVWATWCGPCKQEIPYLAKLVEKYKDNAKVQFVSISIDENVDAWKKMIAKDQPAWPQYNINGQTAKTFMQQWGISGIPRFIMIDKDGNIFSADATRPSEKATAETIDQL